MKRSRCRNYITHDWFVKGLSKILHQFFTALP
jgi:hypothetical protein